MGIVHEEELAYDEGWAYAEDNPQEERIEDNPYNIRDDDSLYDSWREGFFDCMREILA